MESFLESRPLGEESLQMWDLNKRLEAYLARVKFLEEENEVLKSELHRLKGSPLETSWRGKYEEEVAAWRATRDEALREKNIAELARASLYEEVQQMKSRCQKERSAREEAKKLLAMSKNELEEEKRSHIWLREKALQLEKETEVLMEAHKEERAGLGQEIANFSRSLESFCRPPVTFQPVEVEDYSKRLSNIWRGAVETYKMEVSQLEVSFGEAKENLWKATESNRQNQLQLQQLEREVASLKRQKETLEERLVQQWQHQQGEAEKLQLAIEQLEEEKQSLTVQIAQVLEDRQQLMHLKLSLSLEVATYRTLLEAESTRLQMPAEHRLAILSSQDAKVEASNSKCQAVSPERGHLGPRDLRPSPTIFSKGSKTPQLPKNQNGPFAATVASALPKSRSPVVQEFQKANMVLQSQSTKLFDVVGVPGSLDSAAFNLGSSPQKEVVTAPQAGTVSQSPIHEPSPPFSALSPTVPDDLGESSTNAEQSRHIGEGGDENSAQRKAEELVEKATLYEGVKEEEKQPSEEPPWQTPMPNVPSCAQLAMEATVENALQEVQGGDVCSEAGACDVAGTPHGMPSDDSASMQDENRAAAASPSLAAALEVATRKLFKSQTEDLLESIKGFEGSRETDRSQEAGSEQAAEVGGWVSPDAEPPSPQEAELLEEEQSQEEMVCDLPVTEEIACDNNMGALEQKEGGNQRPLSLQSSAQTDELEEVSTVAESASPLDKDAGAGLRGNRGSSELPGTSCPDDHPSALEADVVDTEGGAEDLEAMSTEALHLSEDEERRALSSPSRESEECDFQAEPLDSEFLQKGEFATETLSPVSHSFYSAESHPDHCFLGVEQETSEEQTPLHKTDTALPEEVGREMDSEPETSRAEEAHLSRAEHSIDTLSAEPTAIEGADAEEDRVWEPEQDAWGNEGLFEEENSLGEEETMEKKDASDQKLASSQDGICGEEMVLQQENVESLLKQEASKGEQREGSVEVHPGGDLPAEQEMEEEKASMASPESETPEREDVITEATEMEETEAKASLAEKEGRTGCVSTSDFQEEETPEAKEADTPDTEEQHVAAETEDTSPNQDSLYVGQGLLHETSTEALEVPSEAQSNVSNGPEAKSHGGPQDTDLSSESGHRLQSDDSGSEVSLESLDIPPNVSCETEGIEKDLESSKQIKLEETLPDNTPLHLYDEMMLVLTGKGQRLPENEEATEMPLFPKERGPSIESVEPSVEEVCPYSSQTESDDAKELVGAEEERGCYAEPAPTQDAHTSGKLLISRDLDEAERIRENEDLLPSREPGMPSTEEFSAQLEAEQPGEILKQEGGSIEEEPLCSEMLHEDTGSSDSFGETKRDNVFHAPDPSLIQTDVLGENDRPLEWSDPSHVMSAGSPKVSPLTSVADLGEIVLEREPSPDGQKGSAEPEDWAYYEDKSLLCVHESQPISNLENCAREDLTPQTDVAELNSSGKDFTDPAQKEKVSLPTDTLKDSDILEIVEQALEFNQEFIKAAEQTVETEQLAACGDVLHSTEAENNCSSLALPDVGRVPVFTETPDAPFHSAKDPTGYGHLWAENSENGLQQDSSLADFTSEILNGIGAFHSGNREHEFDPSREELIEEEEEEEEVTIHHDFQKEGLDDLAKLETRNQSPPQTLAKEEAPRTGEISSEIHQTISVEHKGQEGLNVDKNFLAPVKGKDAKMETICIPTHFGEEILHLESSQHQKFQAEGKEELWSPEDN